jgi:hypothetical protein
MAPTLKAMLFAKAANNRPAVHFIIQQAFTWEPEEYCRQCFFYLPLQQNFILIWN